MFETQAYLAAVNALLTEHDLSLIELVPENSFVRKLRDGIHQGFLAGARGRRDDDWWLRTFNHAERVVQLNFVAIGFNELRMPPMLPREHWRPVRNPMVVRGVEHKLPKARAYFQRAHGIDIQLRRSKLVILDWGLSEAGTAQTVGAAQAEAPDTMFMSELPHSSTSVPKHKVTVGTKTFLYYERPKTIGQIVGGGPGMFDYPQCAVIADGSTPLMIVRIEDSGFGSMLCVITPEGRRSNLGPFEITDARSFLLKVSEVVNSFGNSAR
jgi:hypothetical protein